MSNTIGTLNTHQNNSEPITEVNNMNLTPSKTGETENPVVMQSAKVLNAFERREIVVNREDYSVLNSLSTHITAQKFLEFYQYKKKLIDILSSFSHPGSVSAMNVFYHFVATRYDLSFYRRYIDKLKPQELEFLSNDITSSNLINNSQLRVASGIGPTVRGDLSSYFVKSSSQNLTIPNLVINEQYKIPINCLPEHLLIYQYNNRLDFSNAKLAKDGIHVKRLPTKTLSRYDAYKKVYQTASKVLPIPKLNFKEETYSQEAIIRNYLTITHRLWIDDLFKFPEIHQLSAIYSKYNTNNLFKEIRDFSGISNVETDTRFRKHIINTIFDPSFMKKGICSMHSLNFFYYFTDYLRSNIIGLKYSIDADFKTKQGKNFNLDDEHAAAEKLNILSHTFHSWEDDIINYLYSERNLPPEEGDIKNLLIKLYDNPVFNSLYLNNNVFDLDTIFSTDTINFEDIENIFPFNINGTANNCDKSQQ